MNSIVIYKTKYGSTKTYAEWIAQDLGCNCVNVKDIKPRDLEAYDTIIYGGGLYAEVINGVSIITKNIELLKDKKLIVFSTGITPLDCTEYFDVYVAKKNFKGEAAEKIKYFYYLGKMKTEELTVVHRTALKTLKKIMSSKENPTKMEKLLVELCDADGGFSDRNAIKALVDYAKAE